MNSEYFRRLNQKEAQEMRMKDFIRALNLFSEYTRDKFGKAEERPFVFVGEVMHTERGRFRIEHWDFAFNDNIQEIDSIYTLENYTTGGKVKIWLDDLKKNWDSHKMVFVNFKP